VPKLLFAPTPGFLGYDVAKAKKDELESFCEKIIELSPLVRAGGCFRVIIGDDLVGALAEGGRYPYANPLRDALKAQELDEDFSAEDIVRLLHKTLQLGESYINTLGVSDLLVENLVIDPLANYAPECGALRDVESSLLTFWAVGLEAGTVSEGDVICYTSSDSDTISLSAEVTAIDPEGLLQTQPEAFSLKRSLQVISARQSFPRLVNAELVWREANTNQDLAFALSVAAYKLHLDAGGLESWRAHCSFRLGEHFLASLEEVGALQGGHRAGVVFDACARVISGQPKYEISPFGANNREDGAKPCRMHITKKHEALRLMMWELPGGGYELANVGVKQEEEIRRGDPARAYCLDD